MVQGRANPSEKQSLPVFSVRLERNNRVRTLIGPSLTDRITDVLKSVTESVRAASMCHVFRPKRAVYTIYVQQNQLGIELRL